MRVELSKFLLKKVVQCKFEKIGNEDVQNIGGLLGSVSSQYVCWSKDTPPNDSVFNRVTVFLGLFFKTYWDID